VSYRAPPLLHELLDPQQLLLRTLVHDAPAEPAITEADSHAVRHMHSEQFIAMAWMLTNLTLFKICWDVLVSVAIGAAEKA
jgi:hypothetical protein